MRKIKITPTHVYLEDYDIGQYVIDIVQVNEERLTVTLIAEEIIDERKPEKPAPPKKDKKEVKDGNG